MANASLIITVKEDGSRKVSGNLREMTGSAQKAENAVSLLRRSLGLLGAAFSIRALTGYSDAFIDVTSRISAATAATGNLAAMTDELFEVANRTRRSIEETADTFTKLHRITEGLGFSVEETVQVTEALNQALVISAPNTQKARSALDQLMMGLARGELRSRNLVTALGELPVLADVLQKELGVTREELMKMAEQGRVTAETVVTAFKNQREEIGDRFAKETIPTLSEAFTVLRNSLIQFVGAINEGTGIFSLFGDLLLFIARNINTIAKFAIAAGAALGVHFAIKGALAAYRAVLSLNAAIAANPIGAMILALTAAITLIIQFKDEILAAGAAVRDFILRRTERIIDVESVQAVSDLLRQIENSRAGVAGRTLVAAGGETESFRKTQEMFREMTGDFEQQVQLMGKSGVEREKLKAIIDAENRARREGLELTDHQRNVIGLYVTELWNLARAEEAASKAARDRESAGQRAVQRVRQLEELRRGIKQEIELLSVETSQRDRLASIMQIENAVRSSGRLLRESERKEFESLLDVLDRVRAADQRQQEALTEANNRRQEALSIVDATIPAFMKFEKVSAELVKLQEEGTISLFELNRALASVREQYNQLTTEEIKAQEAEAELNRQYEIKERILKEITGPVEFYKDGIRALNELLKDGAISQEQFNKKLEDLERSLKGPIQEIRTLSDAFTDQLATSINRSVDALIDLRRTGSAAFRNLADSIIRDIQRMIARYLILQAVQAATGMTAGTAAMGGGGFAGALLRGLAGFKTGGEFRVGGSGGPDSQLVAFRASPDEHVEVKTPEQKRKEENSEGNTPNVNLRVVNVASREEALAAMGSPEGEQVFLNFLVRNGVL